MKILLTGKIQKYFLKILLKYDIYVQIISQKLLFIYSDKLHTTLMQIP